jgi:hypothetical protein
MLPFGIHSDPHSVKESSQLHVTTIRLFLLTRACLGSVFGDAANEPPIQKPIGAGNLYTR